REPDRRHRRGGGDAHRPHPGRVPARARAPVRLSESRPDRLQRRRRISVDAGEAGPWARFAAGAGGRPLHGADAAGGAAAAAAHPAHDVLRLRPADGGGQPLRGRRGVGSAGLRRSLLREGRIPQPWIRRPGLVAGPADRGVRRRAAAGRRVRAAARGNHRQRPGRSRPGWSEQGTRRSYRWPDEGAVMTTIDHSTEAVVIIGSGAGGGTLAYELTRQGIECVLLEAGPYLRGEDYMNLEWAAFDPMAWTDTRTTSGRGRVAKDFPNLPAWIVKAVGGTTTHWSGATPRFKPHEFRSRSVYGRVDGASLLDWPTSYEELEPYYTRAEDAIGSTHRGGRPPLPANNNYKVLAAGAEKLGYRY